MSENINVALGEDQEKALSIMKDFIQNGTEPACLIYGAAGTGKTILTNYLINWCEKESIPYTLCAPTHKAALVLSRATDRDAITIHSLLSLSPKLDVFALDFNNLLFHTRNSSMNMCYDGVVICDESSMINDDLYDLLLEKCKSYRNRIIFTGDFQQIQPVKQDSLSKIINTQPQFELNKIWRQSENNALLPTLTTLRTHSISHFKESIGLEGSLFVTTDMKDFLKSGVQSFSKAIKNGDILETKILCYTNDRVSAYNNAMHKLIFPKCNTYNKGEFLVGCENLEFNHFKFYNSMDYIICSEPEKIDLPIPNFGKLPAFRFELYDSLYKSSEYVSILSTEISRDYFDLLINKIESFRQQAVSWSAINKAKAKFYWKYYYQMINSFTTPIDFYYDGRLIRKKSFDYAYAVTVHRSQGSSYNNVLVDMRNVNSCSDEAVHRQLQYVALSRTRKDVLLYQ